MALKDFEYVYSLDRKYQFMPKGKNDVTYEPVQEKSVETDIKVSDLILFQQCLSNIGIGSETFVR